MHLPLYHGSREGVTESSAHNVASETLLPASSLESHPSGLLLSDNASSVSSPRISDTQSSQDDATARRRAPSLPVDDPDETILSPIRRIRRKAAFSRNRRESGFQATTTKPSVGLPPKPVGTSIPKGRQSATVVSATPNVPPLGTLRDRAARRRMEDRTRYEIELAGLRAELAKKTREVADLREEDTRKDRVISDLRNHNKALQQLLHDADTARQKVFLEMLDQTALAEADGHLVSATTRASSSATAEETRARDERSAPSRSPFPLRQTFHGHARERLDVELHEALEDLRAFKPFVTPVREWYRVTAKAWDRLSAAFNGITIPPKATQKILQVAITRLTEERRAIQEVLRELQYRQLCIIKKLMEAPTLYEALQEELRDVIDRLCASQKIVSQRETDLRKATTALEEQRSVNGEISEQLKDCEQRLESQTEALQRTVQELHASKSAASETIDQLTGQYNTLAEDLQKARSALAEMTSAYDAEASELKAAQLQLKAFAEKETAWAADLRASSESTEALQKLLEVTQVTLETLERSEAKHTEDLRCLSDALEATKRDRDSLRDERNLLRERHAVDRLRKVFDCSSRRLPIASIRTVVKGVVDCALSSAMTANPLDRTSVQPLASVPVSLKRLTLVVSSKVSWSPALRLSTAIQSSSLSVLDREVQTHGTAALPPSSRRLSVVLKEQRVTSVSVIPDQQLSISPLVCLVTVRSVGVLRDRATFPPSLPLDGHHSTAETEGTATTIEQLTRPAPTGSRAARPKLLATVLPVHRTTETRRTGTSPERFTRTTPAASQTAPPRLLATVLPAAQPFVDPPSSASSSGGSVPPQVPRDAASRRSRQQTSLLQPEPTSSASSISTPPSFAVPKLRTSLIEASQAAAERYTFQQRASQRAPLSSRYTAAEPSQWFSAASAVAAEVQPDTDTALARRSRSVPDDRPASASVASVTQVASPRRIPSDASVDRAVQPKTAKQHHVVRTVFETQRAPSLSEGAGAGHTRSFGVAEKASTFVFEPKRNIVTAAAVSKAGISVPAKKIPLHHARAISSGSLRRPIPPPVSLTRSVSTPDAVSDATERRITDTSELQRPVALLSASADRTQLSDREDLVAHYEALLSTVRREHDAALDLVAKQLDDARQYYNHQLEDFELRYNAVLASARAAAEEYARAMATLKDRHAEELLRAKEMRAADIIQLQEDHAREILALKETHAKTLLELKEEHSTQLTSLRNAHEAALAKAFPPSELRTCSSCQKQKEMFDAHIAQLQREYDAKLDDHWTTLERLISARTAEKPTSKRGVATEPLTETAQICAPDVSTSLLEEQHQREMLELRRRLETSIEAMALKLENEQLLVCQLKADLKKARLDDDIRRREDIKIQDAPKPLYLDRSVQAETEQPTTKPSSSPAHAFGLDQPWKPATHDRLFRQDARRTSPSVLHQQRRPGGVSPRRAALEEPSCQRLLNDLSAIRRTVNAAFKAKSETRRGIYDSTATPSVLGIPERLLNSARASSVCGKRRSAKYHFPFIRQPAPRTSIATGCSIATGYPIVTHFPLPYSTPRAVEDAV